MSEADENTVVSQQSPDGSTLLVIDMQNDFIENSSSGVFLPGGFLCTPYVIHALNCARKSNVPVIWVVREHEPSGNDVELFRLHFYNQPTPGPLIAGSEGAELVEPLKILPGEIKIIKKRFSAYHGTHLDTILKRLRVNHVVLCGVQLPNCIRATAMDAIQLDYQVTVLSDATASRSNAAHNVNLEDLRQVGVHIVGIYDEDSLLDWLRLYRGELQALTRDERRRR